MQHISRLQIDRYGSDLADGFPVVNGQTAGAQVMLIDYWALISHFSGWVGVMRVRLPEQINFTNASRA